MTYIAVRQLLPRLHNLCHVDSKDTMPRYSLNMLNFGSNVVNLPLVDSSGVILVNISIKVVKLKTEIKIGRNAQNTPLKLLRKFPKFPVSGRYLICLFTRWPPLKRSKP